MVWFKKHLNITVVLAYILFLAMAVAIGLVCESVYPMILLALIFYWAVCLWVLEEKGRSAWWILLLPLWSPLWLTKSNKKADNRYLGLQIFKEYENGKIQR